MYYETEAEEKLKEARGHVQSAITALAVIVVDRCGGSSQLSDEREKTIQECFQDLISIRKLL